MKRIIKDYFSFTKKERLAVIVLVVLIAAFIILPNFFKIEEKPIKVDEETKQLVENIQLQKKANASYEKYESKNWRKNTDNEFESDNRNVQLFEFNPNTLSVDEWRRLGLRDKTINTIQNYLSKGGRFKTAEDIRKIWGLRKDEADKLIPYIRIVSTNNNTKNQSNNNAVGNTKLSFDINNVTPEQLKLLPNIGNSLPYKIVNFREKLGGFITISQVKETYGMNDSVYKNILPYLFFQPTEIRKININTASDFELNNHPYIDKTVAKAIVIYRTQHGGYKSVNEIKNIVFLKEEVFNKISPYLKVAD